MKHFRSSLFSLFLLCLAGSAFGQILITPDPVKVGEISEVFSFRNNPQLFRPNTSFKLRLPFVDYNGIPGLYQDATIEYSPDQKAWHLAGYRQGVPVVKWLNEVKVIVTDELPVQVFLELTGTLNNGCEELGQVATKQGADSFTVYLYFTRTLEEFRNCMGTDDVRPFRKVIPLDVYDLPAKTYTYSVNGKFSGTFTLNAHNVLPQLP